VENREDDDLTDDEYLDRKEWRKCLHDCVARGDLRGVQALPVRPWATYGDVTARLKAIKKLLEIEKAEIARRKPRALAAS